jgi:ketosteroid isomerase-like protein
VWRPPPVSLNLKAKRRHPNEALYLYGNTAVVTVLSTWSGKANNQAYSSQFQATHVWAKQQGRWQLVAAHVSPVKK